MFLLVFLPPHLVGMFLAFNLQEDYGVHYSIVVPVIFTLMMGPEVFFEGVFKKRSDIEKKLSEKWRNADELSGFIKRHWGALENMSNGFPKQKACTVFSLVCLISSIVIWVYFKELYHTMALGGMAILLYIYAIFINYPMSTYVDQQSRYSLNLKQREHWRLSAGALVAFSELNPNKPVYKNIADNILSDEFSREILRMDYKEI